MNFNDFFLYENGHLFWKVTRRRSRIGDRAGLFSTKHKYITVGVMRRRYLIHRVIWEMFRGQIPIGIEIDHINRDKRDNRLENLRLSTRNQNLANAGKFHRPTSTSAYKGVHEVKDGRKKKFKVRIKKNKKTFYIGAFESERDAAIAYNKKAKELFGEFAYLNEVA